MIEKEDQSPKSEKKSKKSKSPVRDKKRSIVVESDWDFSEVDGIGAFDRKASAPMLHNSFEF